MLEKADVLVQGTDPGSDVLREATRSDAAKSWIGVVALKLTVALVLPQGRALPQS